MCEVTRQLIYPVCSLKVEIGPSLKLKSPNVKFVAQTVTASALLSVMVPGGGLLRLNKHSYRIGKEYRIKIVDYERFLQQRRTIIDDPQEED